jgi:competence ComEA-like helix-hairpin-helix protein
VIRFTKEEKTILLFLVAALFVGTAVLYHKKLNPAGYLSLQNISFEEKEIKSEKINLNEATIEELMKVKGIGHVLAGRVISYRDKYGPFGRVEDIKEIKGIGDKTFEKIRKGLTIE